MGGPPFPPSVPSSVPSVSLRSASPPILQQLAVNSEGCLELMRGFIRIFRRAAGGPEALRRHAEKWGRQRPPGLAGSRAVFG